MGVERPQRSEARPRLIPLQGEAAGTAFPTQTNDTPANAGTTGQGSRPCLTRGSSRYAPRPLAGLVGAFRRR